MARYIGWLLASGFFCALTLWPKALASTQLAQPNDPPNILVFLADDLTFRDIGAYGNPDVKTPTLDAFANSGLKFTHTFSSSSMCAPTRMELYTGIQPVRNGAYANHSRVHNWVRSFPDYLIPQGYRVGLLGKSHIGPRENFEFEYVKPTIPQNKNQPIDLNAAALFMSRTDTPWFLVVASHQPHGPWVQGSPEDYDPAKLTIPDYFEDTPELRRALPPYYAEIAFLDNQFKTVLSHLDAIDSDRDTLIIFLSEQGASFPFAKWTLYENGQRAAMIVGWHKQQVEHKEIDALIHYADILPTILDITQTPFDPRVFDGRSFAPILLGHKNDHRKYVYGVHTTRGIYYGTHYPVRSIRSKRYKLIWNINFTERFSNGLTNSMGPRRTLQSWIDKGGSAKQRALFYIHRPEFELYDLKTDPFELNNLAGTALLSNTQSNLFAELKRWMTQQGDKGLVTEEKVENVLTRRAEKK